MMVTLFFWLMFFSRFRRRVEFSSSRLDVGSSARIISGLLARALMTAMRCLSPPLRVSGNLLARVARSKYSRSSSVFSLLLCLVFIFL